MPVLLEGLVTSKRAYEFSVFKICLATGDQGTGSSSTAGL